MWWLIGEKERRIGEGSKVKSFRSLFIDKVCASGSSELIYATVSMHTASKYFSLDTTIEKDKSHPSLLFRS